VTVPGFPAYTYDCQAPGWVPILNSATYNVLVQAQQRRLITGQTPAGNSGLDVTSPTTTSFFLLNGIITIGTQQYTRTTLFQAMLANPYFGVGLKLTQSISTQGDLVLELLPYQLKLQFNFWNYNDDGAGGAGQGTFFNLYVVYPDTLLANTGMCQFNAVCPTATQNPLDLEKTSDYHVGRVLTVIPDDVVEQACGSLKTVSDFFYQACKYDIQGAQNPNFANVVIQSLNSVITILSQQNALSSSSNGLVNTTALNITAGGTIAPIPPLPAAAFPTYPPITTNDVTPPLGSSSSSSTGRSSSSTASLGAAPTHQPSISVAVMLLFVSMVLNRIYS